MTPPIRTARHRAAIGATSPVPGCKMLEAKSLRDKAAFKFRLLADAFRDVLHVMPHSIRAGTIHEYVVLAAGVPDPYDADRFSASGEQ